MSLKIEFAERAEKGEAIAALCREFRISRTTGHKWWKRFQEQGYAGLEEQSRRPTSSPLATAEELVLSVLQARDAHPRWGPHKIEGVLRRRFGDQTPSERTIARILWRANRVRRRRKRRALSVVERAPQVHAARPNEVWTVDYKGWWKAANGERCEPLTVRDAHSRFVLACVLGTTKLDAVRQIFEKLFRRHGMPDAIQCDNGTPFVSVRSLGGLTTLSAWWISLGIRLVRSRPGCPQDNGGHERMHRDISQEVQSDPAATRNAQQRALDRWRQEFNRVRPHQALGNQTPAEVYQVTERRPPKTISYLYPESMHALRVYDNGRVCLRGTLYFVSQSLAGHVVGIEPVDAFRVRIWFHDLELGILETVPDVSPTLFELPRPTLPCSPRAEISESRVNP